VKKLFHLLIQFFPVKKSILRNKMFRPSRNFKVPLVYGGQWKDHQTFMRWDPASKRLIQVNCCPVGPTGGGGGGPTGPCPPVDPVDSVTLSNLTESSGDISWVYGGPETSFEVYIYEGVSLPVNTSGTPLFTIGGPLTTPYTASFTPTENYYYVAGIRVKSICGYSDYVYSDPVQYVAAQVNVVGVGTGANTLLYSTDGGLTWTGLGNTIFTTEGNCAAWNGTLWVAGGVGTNSLAYSSDGIAWTGLGEISTGPSTTLTNVSSVSWDGVCWTAVAGDTAYATSFDGINWTGVSGITAAQYLFRSATDGRITVGIPRLGDTLMGYMYNPPNLAVGTITDTNLTNEQIINYTDILWDESKFIITVGTRANANNSKFYSTDGRTWTGIPNVSYVDGTNLGRTTGNFYISRGTTPDSTEKSSDGLTWTSATNPSLPIVQGTKGTIFGTDTRIFVCGFSSSSFVYSTNGTSWTSATTGLSGNFKAGFYKYAPTLLNFEFVRVAGSLGVDPGTGNFTTTLTSPGNVTLQFNKTDTNSIDAADFLYSLSVGTTLKITKNLSNYSTFTIASSSDNGTYWSFACVIVSSVGVINISDTAKLTFA
jgi:hypothetical protein